MKSHTLTRGAGLAGALTLVHASTALAAGGESTPLHLSGSTAVHTATSASSGIVRTIVGLFIVIAVIYGIAWVLRQLKRRDARPSGDGLHHVASLPLGSGRSVALVRAGEELVLLGVAEQNVTPLRTYSEEEAIALGLVPAWGDEEEAGLQARHGSAGHLTRLADTLRRMTLRS